MGIAGEWVQAQSLASNLLLLLLQLRSGFLFPGQNPDATYSSFEGRFSSRREACKGF